MLRITVCADIHTKLIVAIIHITSAYDDVIICFQLYIKTPPLRLFQDGVDITKITIHSVLHITQFFHTFSDPTLVCCRYHDLFSFWIIKFVRGV